MITTNDGREWMRIKEACEFFGIHRRTMHNWIVRGKVETKRDPGGRRWVLVDARGWKDLEAKAV